MFCTCGPAQAYDIDNTDKYAWSENSGWFSFKSAHAPATVYDDHLEGYVWAENIGFVRLGTHTGGGTHNYGNSSAGDYGVNNSSGNLTGYGWSENVGWINFNPSGSQVTVNATTGEFDGYAWAENIGYVHFKNTSPAYMVKYLTTPLLIELAAFTVTPLSDRTLLEWKTSSEIDNIGFHLLRSNTKNGEYTRITPAMIPSATRFSTQGAIYAYVDHNVQPGETYYYKLEDIDLSGVSTMHGPVSATPRLVHGK